MKMRFIFLFQIVIFTFEIIPVPVLSIINARITFLYKLIHSFTIKNENLEKSEGHFRIFHLS